MPTKYAEGTGVSPDRSREEISNLLKKFGARNFTYGDIEEKNAAVIAFKLNERSYRFLINFPRLEDFKFTPSQRRRSPEQTQVAQMQAVREHWRAMVMVVKAKLIAVENRIESFEEAFLNYTVMPNGQTVQEWLEPQLEAAIKNKKMPPQLPGQGQGQTVIRAIE